MPPTTPGPAPLAEPSTARPPASRGFDSPEEFSRRVTPLLPRMLRASRAILGCDDLAWDAVQETLLRIWNRGWLPEDAGPALTHLVRRSSLHMRRCLRRRRFHEEQAGEAHEHRGACCDDDPSLLLEGDESGRQVREAVERISDNYRAVLELFEFEGLSYEAIARRLELPVGTVRSRLSRARAMVRRDLEKIGKVA